MLHWLYSQPIPLDTVTRMIEQVESGSDRDAVIVAASCLEDQLKFAVRCKLRYDDQAVLNELFQMRGPLGSFSAKINLGYLLGLYDKETKGEFDIIKRIRNIFAHRPEEASFETQRVRDLANRLSISQSLEHYRPPTAPHVYAALQVEPKSTPLQKGDHVLLGFGLRRIADHRRWRVVSAKSGARRCSIGARKIRSRLQASPNYIGCAGLLTTGTAWRMEDIPPPWPEKTD